MQKAHSSTLTNILSYITYIYSHTLQNDKMHSPIGNNIKLFVTIIYSHKRHTIYNPAWQKQNKTTTRTKKKGNNKKNKKQTKN